MIRCFTGHRKTSNAIAIINHVESKNSTDILLKVLLLDAFKVATFCSV